MAKKAAKQTIVTKKFIHHRYWHGAAYELEHLGYISNTENDKNAPTRKRGALKKYKVLKPLPEPAEFEAEAKAKIYTFTLQDALEQAAANIEEIKDEMVDWRDNMEQSEGLSQTEKFQSVQEAADALEYIDIPDEMTDVPEFLQEQEDADGKVTRAAFHVTLPTHLPTWFSWRARRKRTGRTARLGDAAAVCERCSNALQEDLDSPECGWDAAQKATVKDMIHGLAEVVSELESVDCPGMY